VPRTLLLVYAVVFTLGFGGPLLIAPIAWARAIGWTIPEPRELTVYFGRCLGAVAVAIAGNAIAIADDPAAVAHMLALVASAFTILAAVHAWGWMRGTQPRFENYETFGYAALAIVTIVVRARAS
jgi:hypothetical protein